MLYKYLESADLSTSLHKYRNGQVIVYGVSLRDILKVLKRPQCEVKA